MAGIHSAVPGGAGSPGEHSSMRTFRATTRQVAPLRESPDLPPADDRCSLDIVHTTWSCRRCDTRWVRPYEDTGLPRCWCCDRDDGVEPLAPELVDSFLSSPARRAQNASAITPIRPR
jgi:hypothetical protein